MLNNEFDIIGISEAGLNNLNRCAYVMGDSYFFDYKPLTKNKGGVGVYIHKRLTASRRTDLECNTNPNIENLWYELETNHTKYLVGVIYRHPGYQTQKVCDFLDICLNVAKSKTKSCIIMKSYNPNFRALVGGELFDKINCTAATVDFNIYTSDS